MVYLFIGRIGTSRDAFAEKFKETVSENDVFTVAKVSYEKEKGFTFSNNISTAINPKTIPADALIAEPSQIDALVEKYPNESFMIVYFVKRSEDRCLSFLEQYPDKTNEDYMQENEIESDAYLQFEMKIAKTNTADDVFPEQCLAIHTVNEPSDETECKHQISNALESLYSLYKFMTNIAHFIKSNIKSGILDTGPEPNTIMLYGKNENDTKIIPIEAFASLCANNDMALAALMRGIFMHTNCYEILYGISAASLSEKHYKNTPEQLIFNATGVPM